MNLATAGPALGGLSGISTGLGAFSQIGGGLAQFHQAKANAKALNRIGKIEAADVRRQTRRLLGREQVAAAASGVDPTQGSALDIQAEAALEGEVAALRARFARDSQARAIKAEGKAALIRGISGASSSLLGGLAGQLGGEENTQSSGGSLTPAGERRLKRIQASEFRRSRGY